MNNNALGWFEVAAVRRYHDYTALIGTFTARKP